MALLPAASSAAQEPVPLAHTPLANAFNATWQPLGPATVSSLSYGSISGRFLSLAVDPNDLSGNTVYAGSAGGGVWKSANAAGPLSSVTFEPLTDTLPVFNSPSNTPPSLAIGALTVQPRPNPVLLAGTGDATGSADSLYGEGILRSADGGLTWTLIQTANDLPNAVETFSGLASSGFAWSTLSSSLVVASFTDSPQGIIAGATGVTSIPGLYYSTDAGLTWHIASVFDGATAVQQPQPVRAALGNSATSVVWNAQRKMFFAALRSHGYYSSLDGMTWKRLTSQPGSSLSAANCPVGSGGLGRSTCPIYRGTLSVQPVSGDTYAWTVDSNGVDQGVWQDLCALGTSGSCNSALAFANRVDRGAVDDAGTGKVAHALTTLSLLAAPSENDGTTLYVGAADLYRCVLAPGSSACTFRNSTNSSNACATPAAVAPGQHALATPPSQSATSGLLLANDGGLWRSSDGVNESGAACSVSDAGHFENLNVAIGSGGSAAEIVGLAQDPSDASILLAGLGANGTAAAQSTPNWAQLTQAEGGFPHIDPVSSTNWYATVGAGVNLKRCGLGSACGAADFLTPATIGPPQIHSDASLIHEPSLLDPAQSDNVLFGTCRVWRGPANSGDLWSDANAISAPLAGAAPCTSANPLIRSLAAGGPPAMSADAQHNGSTVIYAGMAGSLDGGGVLGGHLFMTAAANTADANTRWADVSTSTVTNDTGNGGVFNASSYAISSLFVDSHDATGATVYATIQGFGLPSVYRSIDFGKHWLNLTSNLPYVPANSVVVDPNDANTVYIALDSGVYATTAVNTCAAVDCWARLGSGLPNSQVTQLVAGALLPTGDGNLGLLRASTYGRGIWQIPLLASVPIAAPALTVTPVAVVFGTQQVGTQSDAQTLTVTSSGNAAVSIASLTVPSGFIETDTCAGRTLVVGDQCAVQVRFAPVTTGSDVGVLTVFANVPGGQTTVGLSGTASAPASIVLTPSALTFAATVVHQSAASQIITVANTGGVTATLQAPVVSGDFAIVANTCSTTLVSQTACAVSIQFTPTDKGTRTGTLTVTDSVGVQTASLSGTGESPSTDTLNVSSLSFPQQAAGSTSSSQQVTLTNAGDVPLLLNSVVGSGDFTINNNCGTSLPGQTTCSVDVRFVPTAVGTRSGTLTIQDQYQTQTVALLGIAVAPAGVSLSPSALSFAATGVGLSASAQTVTLTNNGGLPLVISKQSVSGDFALAANTCGPTLAVSAACTMTVVFTPSAAGARTGTLTLTDSAPSGTQTVSLNGAGIDFTLTPNGPTSQTVASGSIATYAMTMQSVTGLSGNIAFDCSGAPAHSVCSVNPGAVSLGGNANFTVTVQTGLATASLEPLKERLWPGASTLAFAMLFPVCALFRKKCRGRALYTLAVICLTGISGCGTPRTIPGSGGTVPVSTPTPAGTYTLTLTGTSAGISHSVPLTLIVQ